MKIARSRLYCYPSNIYVRHIYMFVYMFVYMYVCMYQFSDIYNGTFKISCYWTQKSRPSYVPHDEVFRSGQESHLWCSWTVSIPSSFASHAPSLHNPNNPLQLSCPWHSKFHTWKENVVFFVWVCLISVNTMIFHFKHFLANNIILFFFCMNKIPLYG